MHRPQGGGNLQAVTARLRLLLRRGYGGATATAAVTAAATAAVTAHSWLAICSYCRNCYGQLSNANAHAIFIVIAVTDFAASK